jgi:hypothetical protein
VIGKFEPLVNCTGPDGHGCEYDSLVEGGRSCSDCHRKRREAREYMPHIVHAGRWARGTRGTR